MFSLDCGNLIRISNNGWEEEEVIHLQNNKFVIGSTPLSDYRIENAKDVCCEIFTDDHGRVSDFSSPRIISFCCVQKKQCDIQNGYRISYIFCQNFVQKKIVS